MREMLLVFGAFTILAVISLSVNRMVTGSTEQLINNEARSAGIALAQQLLDEVTSTVSFDEKTIGGKSIESANDLSSVLGLDAGDTKKDDVDDYHGYSVAGDSTRFVGFILSVQVAYADTSNPRNNSGTLSLLKRVSVTVKNQTYMSDSLTLSSLVAYY